VKKDTENEGRSGDVYENKWHDDIMPEKNSNFVSEIAGSSQNFAGFSRNTADLMSDHGDQASGWQWNTRRCFRGRLHAISSDQRSARESLAHS
jgi:hypothetical protein